MSNKNQQVTATFPYPGGKSEYVEFILSVLPPHTCYVEPFGGSGTVLLNKPESQTEVYNDINDDVVTFFRVLRERGEELKEWLQSVPYARSVYEDWANDWFAGNRPTDPVVHAGRFFALRYMQINGRVDAKAGFIVRNKWPPSRTFRNAVDELHTVRDRYREVTIECEDWQTIFDTYDADHTLFYLDPPYQDKGEYYNDTIDYDAFTTAVGQLEGDWILSCRRIPDDITPVTTRSLETNLEMKNRSEAGKTTERLALSFDPDATGKFTDEKTVQTKL